MKPPEDVKRDLVRQWVAKADEDLAVARYLLSGMAHFGAVGFHAQQAVEKSLKAFLVYHQIEFPKTHDLGQLLDLVARRTRRWQAISATSLSLTPTASRLAIRESPPR